MVHSETSTYKRFLLISFLVFLALHVIIFRSIIFNIIGIWSGDKIVAAEELIPFFNFKTQYLDQIKDGYSQLTNNHEIRIRYSALITWVRHQHILPVALIFLNTISATLMALSAFLLTRISLPKASFSSLAAGSITGASVIHLLLLYSKITHFYTLIFGFSLFVLALSLLIYGLLGNERIKMRPVLLASVIMLLNPGVHYFPLSLIVLPIIFVLAYLRYRYDKDKGLADLWKAGLLVVGIGILPYALAVKLLILDQASDLSLAIPVYHQLIESASPSFAHVLSMDLAGPVDNFRLGSYLPATPRYQMAIYVIASLAALPLLSSDSVNGKSNGSSSYPVILLGIIILVGFWFVLGYQNPWSFYSLTQNVAPSLYASDSSLGNLILKVFHTLVEVLRFPHRFQFLIFFSVLGLTAVAITAVIENTKGLLCKIKSVASCKPAYLAVGIGFLFLSPLLSIGDYRSTLLSGDFAGFLSPYPVPDELGRIREHLNANNDGHRVLVWPSISGGLKVKDNEDRKHLLHDKTFIYYLDQPSLDYAVGGSVYNKQQMFMAFRSIRFNESWWISIIRHNDVKYIVYNHDVAPPDRGRVDLPGVEEQILTQLTERGDVRFVMRGEHYSLFEVLDPYPENQEPVFVNLDWLEFLAIVQRHNNVFDNSRAVLTYEPLGSGSEALELFTRDQYKATLDMNIKQNELKNFFVPADEILPFTTSFIPSTQYTHLSFSLFSLLATPEISQYGMTVPGLWDTLTLSFVGGQEPATYKFDIWIDEPGVYEFYLRGVATENEIEVTIRGNGVNEKMDLSLTGQTPGLARSFSYYSLTGGGYEAGKYEVTLKKMDSSPLLVEGVAVIDEDESTFAGP